MEFHINKDDLLQNLPLKTYNLLTISLERNSALKKIEEKCPDIYEVIQPTYRQPCRTLIEQLLANLIEMRCTIHNLTDILRTSELYEAASIFATEYMKVKKQLTGNVSEGIQTIQRGKESTLEFFVSGIPEPKYRWYKNDVLIPQQNESKLYFNQYTPELSGNYCCEAIQNFGNETTRLIRSNVVKVETLQEKCVIIKKPKCDLIVRSTPVPQEVELEIVANGYPKPEYQWIHNNKVLSITTPNLKITNEKKFEGEYRCRVSNAVSNDQITVTHYKVIDDSYIFHINLKPVVEKIALLIANQNYANYDALTTPLNDAKAMCGRLEQRGFLVLNSSDLTLVGMRNALKIFTEMCVPGCVAFFYFSGHGFELNDKYLMPIDTPDIKSMRRIDSVSEYQILHQILNKKPKLFVSILDMCLKLPNRAENSEIYDDKTEVFNYKSDRNLIQGYSTSTGSSAFEIGERKNGLYNTLLTKQIDRNLPILQILLNVNREFKRLADQNQTNQNINRIKEQMPSLYFNVAEDYRLDAPKKGHPISVKLWDLFK